MPALNTKSSTSSVFLFFLFFFAPLVQRHSSASSPGVCSGSCGREERRDARRVLERHKEVHEADWQRTLLLIQLFLSPRTFREYSYFSPLYGKVPGWITGMHTSRQGHPTFVRGKALQCTQYTMQRCSYCRIFYFIWSHIKSNTNAEFSLIAKR